MRSSVIDAAARFGCCHLYAATHQTARFMFVCVRCGHQAEDLALEAQTLPGHVIAFPRQRRLAAGIPRDAGGESTGGRQ
jgi:hypothetical protein